ncbi:FKBP-type peptidyl-prolyl cis-trans isomerase [Candidatus Saccharibacteria bacterium]|nr:FKBP-type peptidyl-prolyl cis-trans isomerase [Candidatus Saccharibacteria bacterium]
MKEFLHRGGWLFLAILFIVTALGVGVYAFVVNTHPASPDSSYIKCNQGKIGEQKPGSNGKYEGAQLVDFKPVNHVSYVQCQDSKVGTGATATATSTVTATYTGALASTGKIFQSSLDTGQPFTTALNQVIQGWQASIPGMKVGGTRRMMIPAQYAYGPSGGPGIPPNSDLVFDVTLLAVK